MKTLFDRGLIRSALALLAGLVLVATAPLASAQNAPSSQTSNGGMYSGARSMSASLMDPVSATVTAVSPTRLDRQRHRNGVYTTAPTMVQIMSSSQSEMNTAGVECRVVDAALKGYNAEQQAVYEVSCGSGMGYIVGAASPPQVTDCVTVATRAAMATQADPRATPLKCALSANQNVTGMITDYARQAGIGCDVDAAAVAGTSVAGNPVYEVGCKGVDGYWVEKASAGWVLTPCVKVAALNNACRFTTHDEQTASVRTWLAGTPGAACDVTDVRYMGANANGSFYETKCGAGDGFIARFDSAMAVQQVLPCAQAAAVGGGCTLGTRPSSNP